MMEPCMYLKGFDYFHGSEVPYIFGCIIVCFIPITIACLAYAVIKVFRFFSFSYPNLKDVGSTCLRSLMKVHDTF